MKELREKNCEKVMAILILNIFSGGNFLLRLKLYNVNFIHIRFGQKRISSISSKLLTFSTKKHLESKQNHMTLKEIKF